jgi:hypothetical protein
MLKDIIILAIGAIFGLGATMAGVAAPSYFPSTPSWVWHWLFWGGIALMGLMLIDGIWLLIQRPSLRSAALVNCGLLLVIAGVISEFDDRSSSKAGTRIDSKSTDIPPIASLRYVSSSIVLGHSQSLNEWSGKVNVNFTNSTDKTIYYSAIADGNINGTMFPPQQEPFLGYIEPSQTVILRSARILGLKIDDSAGYSVPAITAIYEYNINYRYADGREFTRRTAKRLKLEQRMPVPNNLPPGSHIQSNVDLSTSNEVED